MVAFPGSHQREAILHAVQAMYTKWQDFRISSFIFRPAVRPVPSSDIHEPSSTRFLRRPWNRLRAWGIPLQSGRFGQGDQVLDVGSGSGTDALVAATLIGPRGKVWVVDMTAAMLSKARANAAKMPEAPIEFRKGNAEKLPLPDAAVDVVTSNGVLNLVPDKPRAFAEIFRVLRPGGRIQIADIVLGTPILPRSRENPQLWAECIVGAVLESEYQEMLRAAGFQEVEVVRELDYFSKSAEADTQRVATFYGAKSVTIKGCKL